MRLLVGLSVCFASIYLPRAFVYDRLSRSYVPENPPSVPLLGASSDLKIGSPIPPVMASLRGSVLIVHNSCDSCSLNWDQIVGEGFNQPNAINVVVADDFRAYRRLAERIKTARVRYFNSELAFELNLAFSPRVYAFDRSGHLAYLQELDGSPLKLEVARARSTVGN
jgi:hypothetical protein